MPGMIGTSMPAVAGPGHEVVVELVVEEQLGDQEARARVDLLAGVAQVGSAVGRVECTSGKQAAPTRSRSARGSARSARASSSGRRVRPPFASPRAADRRAGRARSRSRRRACVQDRRSSSSVSPTQVKCAIASRPWSALIRETMSTVASRGRAAGAVGHRDEVGSSRALASAARLQVRSPSSVFGGKNSNEKTGRRWSRSSAMRT